MPINSSSTLFESPLSRLSENLEASASICLMIRSINLALSLSFLPSIRLCHSPCRPFFSLLSIKYHHGLLPLLVSPSFCNILICLFRLLAVAGPYAMSCLLSFRTSRAVWSVITLNYFFLQTFSLCRQRSLGLLL